jgi:hypothetical protein
VRARVCGLRSILFLEPTLVNGRLDSTVYGVDRLMMTWVDELWQNLNLKKMSDVCASAAVTAASGVIVV